MVPTGFPSLGDDEGRQILVDRPRKPRAQHLDRGRSAVVLVPFAEDVRVPAFLDHIPVGFVAIHGDVHPATTRGNPGVKTAAADFGQEGLERQHIIESTGLGDVPPIDQDVNPHRRHAFFPGAQDHCPQVIDVAMDIAVGEETDEVDHAAPALGAGNDLLPGGTLPDRARGDGAGDQGCALTVNLTGADRIVTDLGVAHVLVGRHADGNAMGAQGDVRVVGEKPVKGRLSGSSDGAPDIGLGDAVAVHDDRDDRALNSRERGRFLQHDGFLGKWNDVNKGRLASMISGVNASIPQGSRPSLTKNII
jgi:hypothetical protein